MTDAKVTFTRITLGQAVAALDGGKQKHAAYNFSGGNTFYEYTEYTANALEADTQTTFGLSGFTFDFDLTA